ncbi:MAG: AAA family ATPase [Chloroflexota bacterium]|nr:AAA family ATPase [Chloroflexota bacterium]
MALMPPTLLVVSGPPASGKTTLAHALAQAVHCPAICRDEIKEGLVRGVEPESFAPQRGDAANHMATATFFDVVELMLRHGVSLVAEAAFKHQRWAARLTAFGELSDVRVINCVVDHDVARQRSRQRWINEPWRRRFHADPDPERLAGMGRLAVDQPGGYQPIDLDLPTLVVNTSDGYRPGFDEIVAFAGG